jgi:hypothetical protein
MTDSLTVELHPVWTAGGSRGYRYNVTWNGECLISLSHDPETDLARALLAKGIKGVVTVHDGKTGKRRSKVNIEAAAKMRTSESDSGGLGVKPWEPFDASRVAPRTDETSSSDMVTPDAPPGLPASNPASNSQGNFNSAEAHRGLVSEKAA